MDSEKLLVVVDMQNDFISGSLGTAEAVAIVPNVVKKIKEFEGDVVFTKDTHLSDYPETQEGKNLPVPHCIKGTEGWMLCDELVPLAEGCPVFEKPTFGSVALAQYIADKDYGEIELVGLCTDICVLSNALLIKAYLPECPICVDAACCAGVTPESHRNALEAMKMCQVHVV